MIGRIFITGVSPITLVSMTSGFTLCAQGCNISTNLLLNAHFNEMCGFTSKKMEYLISKTSNIENPEQMLKEMKQYYDGYMFSRDGKHHTFNPNMTLYYLDHWQSMGRTPDNILDNNIFSDYQKLENLLHLSYQQNQSETIQILLDGKHPSVSLTEMFQMNADLSTDDFLSSRFYLGYLTIDEADEFGMTLKIPNVAMQKVFTSYFQQMLKQKAVIELLKKDQIKPLIECIEAVLHRYPDRMFQNFHERNIQQIIDMIILPVNGINCDLEAPNDEGYSDFVMIPSNPKYPNKLMEFKYLKKDYTETQLQEAIEQAKKQIKRYRETRQMIRSKCDSHIMVFAKDTCVYYE